MVFRQDLNYLIRDTENFEFRHDKNLLHRLRSIICY